MHHYTSAGWGGGYILAGHAPRNMETTKGLKRRVVTNLALRPSTKDG